jgi:outer membrane protein OmpA-like peptidoglycan-associated protein
MIRFTALSSMLLSLALVACQKPNASAEAIPVQAAASPGTAGAPIPDAPASAAVPQPPAQDMLAFAAGTQIVAKPQDNQGLFQMDSDPINLIDEAASTDWTAIAKPVPVVVFELPERTEVERLVFDSAGLNRDEKSPKSVKVELSDAGIDSGYTTILETQLEKARNDQSFAVAEKTAGRWLRLSVASNYGDDYVGMTGLHAYGKQLTQDAALADVSGTYDGWNGWGKVRLKQEGTRVTGCYEYRDGVIAGGIEGRLMKAAMQETDDDGKQTKQLGLFSFSPDGALVMGLARAADAEPGAGFSTFYTGKKLGNDIGDCPRIPGWKGNAAQSQIGEELANNGRARLDGINFDFSSARLQPESEPLLKQVAAMLNGHPDWTLTLEGHTDNVGGEAYNQRLSEQRAAAVVAYLVAQGVDAKRLDSAGFGMDKPVTPNDSEAGRAQNRRVEIVRK